MKFCQNCGAQVPEGTNFCPTCGGPVDSTPLQQPVPTTNANDTQTEKALAAISYLGILGLIFHLAKVCKTDFGKFHALQAANVFILELIVNVAVSIIRTILRQVGMGWVGSILGLAGTAVWILGLVGLVYAIQGKKEELPIIKDFKILK